MRDPKINPRSVMRRLNSAAWAMAASAVLAAGVPVGCTGRMSDTLEPPAALAAPPPRLDNGDHQRELLVNGQSRSYLVHIPESYNPMRPTPLVLVFHGLAVSSRMMAEACGINAKADQAGFIAVYPQGVGPMMSFNTSSAAVPGGADDVAFTASVLDDLAKVASVDRRRVYATGYSNGAAMCYRLALELSDRIAAIAPVAGTLCGTPGKPKHPMP